MPRELIKAAQSAFLTAAMAAGPATLAAPDPVVLSGDIYTVDRALQRAEAFAGEAGRSSAVGSNADIRSLAGPDTRAIDAAGPTVTPGFIDSHSHTSGNSPEVAGVDLSYIVDKADWLQRKDTAERVAAAC